MATTVLADAGPLQPVIDWVSSWRTGMIILGVVILGIFAVIVALKGGFKAAFNHKEGMRDTLGGFGALMLCAAILGFAFLGVGIGLSIGKKSGTQQQQQQLEQQLKNGDIGTGIG